MKMTYADFAAYHAAQAVHFHQLAQIARKRALEAKGRRQWLEKLIRDEEARMYRNTRDHHKVKAREHAALA